MIKVFVTGDNHIGINYNRYPNIREELKEGRLQALDRMVKKADEENCELFVVTGDLFEKVTGITKESVKRVADILSRFDGEVVIIPGNHDFYTDSVDIWKKFNLLKGSNTFLLNEYREYPIDIGENKVVFYPAFCNSKHSDTNRLEWIKTAEINRDVYNIGIAHGAVEGISPDTSNKYFYMRQNELETIPVDVWLIGHTHLQFPDNLSEDKETEGYKIFNAGTHEQEDLGDNTEGVGFIITIDKQSSHTRVLARKYISGKYHFSREMIRMAPENPTALNDKFTELKEKYGPDDIVDIILTGSIKPEEYMDRTSIYKSLEDCVKDLSITDNDLCEEITSEKINDEFAQTSFAAQFLEEFTDDPILLQLAYGLVKDCQE